MTNYTDYVMMHRKGVIDTWEHILKPVLVNEISEVMVDKIDSLLRYHDQSKIAYNEEYIPYSKHYEDPQGYPKSNESYKKGWNHHQKCNPHHWQYWVVLEDIVDPKVYALEMDFEYVIEMLCDWQSASNYYGNTAHWWYDTQKGNMIMHPKTRELVERYLDYLD